MNGKKVRQKLVPMTNYRLDCHRNTCCLFCLPFFLRRHSGHTTTITTTTAEKTKRLDARERSRPLSQRSNCLKRITRIYCLIHCDEASVSRWQNARNECVVWFMRSHRISGNELWRRIAETVKQSLYREYCISLVASNEVVVPLIFEMQMNFEEFRLAAISSDWPLLRSVLAQKRGAKTTRT